MRTDVFFEGDADGFRPSLSILSGFAQPIVFVP